MRRTQTYAAKRVYVCGDLIINFEKHRVTLENEPIHLTQIEYRLLTLLARNAGRILTYDDILNIIWGPYETNNQILRVNMTNIRRKLEKKSSEPRYVFTKSGVGYFMPENEYKPV